MHHNATPHSVARDAVYHAHWQYVIMVAHLSDLPALCAPCALFSVPLYIFTTLTALFFLSICNGRATRWLLALFLIVSSQTAYYMDTFGVVIDSVMIDNMLQTSAAEFSGLLSLSLVVRTLFLGLLPAYFVWRYCPTVINARAEYQAKFKLIGFLLLLLLAVVIPFTAGYTSFIREHKITRFYANPSYASYASFKYLSQQLDVKKSGALRNIAQDAVALGVTSKPELIILVVGETARADRFSLNGYHKLTNPMLAKEKIVSFSNVTSCGTSTSVSVPCMFSALGRKDYDKARALSQENALDVLADNGVEILWRDNNSDSKGVATRLNYQDFKSPTMNTVCEGECRDIGMLHGLDKFIASKKGKEILIVLHQMGNHGPEYYRRYPKEFARFKPMCMTGELQECTQAEIDNSYDNAILYTDYFLANVIGFLKKYDATYATAMLYVADHGESLGEHGFYLHAAPYLMAPKEQTHIPAIMWMGRNFDYKLSQLMPYKDYPLSHDDLFCSLLIGFELDSQTCVAKKKILLENLDIKAQMHVREQKLLAETKVNLRPTQIN